MPNPLTSLLPAPAEGAKSSVLKTGQKESDTAFSFEDIFSEETTEEGATVEVDVDLVAESEQDLDKEDAEPEVSSADDTPLDPEMAVTFGPHAQGDQSDKGSNNPTETAHLVVMSQPAMHPHHLPLKAQPDPLRVENADMVTSQVRNGNKAQLGVFLPTTRQEPSIEAQPQNPGPGIVSPDRFSKSRAEGSLNAQGTQGFTAKTKTPAPAVAAKAEPSQPHPIAIKEDIAVEISDLDPPPPTRETTATQSTRDKVEVPATASGRAETARAIAGQLAAAVSPRPGSGGVEIALNPEELGRVSITLNGREDGLMVSIAVERPETLDLMRRHISVLSAEFQRMGYGAMSFDLGSSDKDWQDTDASDTRVSSEIETPDDVPDRDEHPQPMASVRGLDMRL